MKERRKTLNSDGITLVALVIIVIILIILSAITIRAVIGEHGSISSANLAKEETRASIVQEEADAWRVEKEYARDQGKKARPREEVLNKLIEEGFLTEEEKKIIEEKDCVKIASKTIVFEQDGVVNRKFKIRAVDDNDNSLPDCTVQVYEDQACEKLIKEVNTSLDSDIYNWGSNVPPKGTYYAKVTKVPLGYNIPSNT